MKQKLESLLQHFDDDGKLLPGRKMVVTRPSGESETLDSNYTTLTLLCRGIGSGNEYRIDLTPVAPRVVWYPTFNADKRLDCETAYAIKAVCDQAYSRTANYAGAIRFIEDKPLPVSDEDVFQALNTYYKNGRDSLRSYGTGLASNMRAVLEQRESKRTEHL